MYAINVYQHSMAWSIYYIDISHGITMSDTPTVKSLETWLELYVYTQHRRLGNFCHQKIS